MSPNCGAVMAALSLRYADVVGIAAQRNMEISEEDFHDRRRKFSEDEQGILEVRYWLCAHVDTPVSFVPLS